MLWEYCCRCSSAEWFWFGFEDAKHAAPGCHCIELDGEAKGLLKNKGRL